jgi:hypothetical protein
MSDASSGEQEKEQAKRANAACECLEKLLDEWDKELKKANTSSTSANEVTRKLSKFMTDTYFESRIEEQIKLLRPEPLCKDLLKMTGVFSRKGHETPDAVTGGGMKLGLENVFLSKEYDPDTAYGFLKGKVKPFEDELHRIKPQVREKAALPVEHRTVDPGDPVPVDSMGHEPVRLDKDFLQKNIDRSIEYRKEYYKYNIGIATALLAFTVSFPSTLSKVDYPNLIFSAWVGLGVTVLSGVASHILWSNFFITWRNYDNRGQRQRGQAARAPITGLRRLFDALQIAGLVVGVGGVVLFAGFNLGNIALKEKPASLVPPLSGTPAPGAPPPGNTGRTP